MPVKKFAYSWAILVQGIVLPGFLILACLTQMGRFNWMVCVVVSILLGLFAFYNCRRFITYNLQLKVALILDNEKLEYPPGDIIVYWKDVTSIDYTRSSGGAIIEYITLTTKNDIKSIETRLIAGSSNDIYKTVFEYYNNCP